MKYALLPSRHIFVTLAVSLVLGTPLLADEQAAVAANTADKWQAADAGGSHWAYQQPIRHAVPHVADPSWPRQRLDYFVLAALEENGLAPSADAEANVLLRRLHFDLVGLPPTPARLDRFHGRIETEGFERAWSMEVDELLAAPQFGERWGRHWLDVARFAESSGKEANISFPYAWRYRDYVIDSINADLPFDRFVVEQIAGDLLPFASDAERARLLIATGFLALGPKNLDEMYERQFQADLVDEQLDTVTRAVMGSSIACARCHDHKFDPFSMRDYYALAGIFSSTKTFFGTAISPANRVGGDPLPLPAEAGQLVLHSSIAAEKVESLQAELAALQRQREEGMAAVQEALAAGEDPTEQFSLTDALRIFWRSGAIEGQLEKVGADGHALPLAMGVLDHRDVQDAPLLQRGEVQRPGEKVPRGFPEVFTFDQSPQMDPDQSGRRELARWLTHPDHPLTSRVLVNRLWHHLMGAGLVRTVDNFGTNGEPPSHPQLLDELALGFVERDWSIKSSVREIVLSRTYRQSSVWSEESFFRDPENRLLWRMPKRRLTAESIRDAMLAVAGDLDRTRPPGSLVARTIGDGPIALIGMNRRLPPDLDGARYRSVYLPVIRDRLPDVLDLFDCAEPNFVTGSRETTNVPVQALYLMNSGFVRQRAEGLADRLLHERDLQARVELAFRLCLSRTPDSDELQHALDFLSGDETDDSTDVRDEALVNFCQALLSTAEFRNLD